MTPTSSTVTHQPDTLVLTLLGPRTAPATVITVVITAVNAVITVVNTVITVSKLRAQLEFHIQT